MDAEGFESATRAGAFTLTWEAHDLRYGIPASIDADIRAGRTVVCNVSRAIIGAARERYAEVLVVLVTAPPEILAARLAARGRDSDGDLERRLTRSENFAALAADCVITNVGAPEAAAAVLIETIARPASSRPTTAAERSSASAS